MAREGREGREEKKQVEGRVRTSVDATHVLSRGRSEDDNHT